MSEAPAYSTRRVAALRLPEGTDEHDLVAVEEPLEIRIAGEPVSVTMRTPGHDVELALGFCLTEGLEPRAARVPDDLQRFRRRRTVRPQRDAHTPVFLFQAQQNFPQANIVSLAGPRNRIAQIEPVHVRFQESIQ